jgi:signal transduction histidine kinase
MAPMDKLPDHLRRLLHPGADVVLALVLTVAFLLEPGTTDERGGPALVLLTLPLIWRRRYPIPVFCAIVLGAFMARGGAYVGITSIVIAAYSISVYARRELLGIAVLLGTAVVVAALFGADFVPLIPRTAGPFLLLIPAWLVGQEVRTRQLRADALADKARLLEREQEAAARAAIAEERGRIARELHDVVAHSVSVMLVQAGAARHVLASAPDQAREALLAVESSGREAMAELRRLLGVLHEQDDGLALAPQPGVEAIEPLLKRVSDAGLPVTLRVEGQPRVLTAGLNLAVYRIVQEALTNALKHAGLVRTEVTIQYREADLMVEVLDEGTGSLGNGDGQHGHGLLGMRERVALYGGTLEAGPRPGRGYAVRAWLPLDGHAS